MRAKVLCALTATAIGAWLAAAPAALALPNNPTAQNSGGLNSSSAYDVIAGSSFSSTATVTQTNGNQPSATTSSPSSSNNGLHLGNSNKPAKPAKPGKSGDVQAMPEPGAVAVFAVGTLVAGLMIKRLRKA